MNKTKIALLLFSILTTNIYATNLGGVITADTLKEENSPYVAIGNLSIVANDTVVIEPGVVIKFNTGLTFTVNGALLATGTTSDSILFTSNAISKSAGDWGGITFTSTGDGNLKNVVVEFAASAVTVVGTSPTITKSYFRQNNNGIDCLSSAAPSISWSAFSGQSNAAIRCDAASPVISKNAMFNNVAVSSVILCENSSSPQITQNAIFNNDNTGIDCNTGSNAKVWNNTLYGNAFGVTISDASAPSLRNNIIVFHENLGVAINDAEASPEIAYNDVWANTAGDYFGAGSGIGVYNSTNYNGDASDTFFNISKDPKMINPTAGDFELHESSPCLDGGDPANPANVSYVGARPDVGALEYNGAVPVELVSFVFEGEALRWRTASETNNFGFEIQRTKTKAGQFVTVGFVIGAGTSVSGNYYYYKDDVNAGKYFYRLKQIDTDGTFSFSNVLTAVYATPKAFVLAQNYPNPFNPSTTISFEIPGEKEALVFLSVYDLTGRQIKTLLKERKRPGFHQIKWNGDDKLGKPVASGIYFYRLVYENQVLVRKMQLVR